MSFSLRNFRNENITIGRYDNEFGGSDMINNIFNFIILEKGMKMCQILIPPQP